VINIGGGTGVRMRDAAHLLVRASGFEGRLLEEARSPIPGADGADRPGEVLWRQADIRTARERLGWRPRVPLEESLADIWTETACRV
jgi:nucleoside-diphosphate-sugar epimerase